MRRQEFLDAAAPLTPYVAVELPGGAPVVVATVDGGEGRLLFEDPSAAVAPLAAALEAAGGMRGRAAFVDAAAGAGASVVAAITELGFERALACEPLPDAYLLLRVNVAANGLAGRVTAVPVLATDADGPRRLAVDPADWRQRRVTSLKAAAAAGEPRPARVEGVPLDEAAARAGIRAGDVALIRLPAGPLAGATLEGARELLAAGTAVVVEHAGRDEHAARAALAGTGLRPVALRGAVAGVPPSG